MAHALVVLLVLSILVLSLSLLFTIKHRKLLLELVVFHTKLTSDGNESAQAIDVILILFVDLLVHLQSLVEEVHSSVAGGDHELPFDFLWLDLARTLEILDGFFEHVLFGVVHTKARNDIDLGGIVAVTFLVEMHSLELVLLLLVQVAHLGENLGV